MICTQGDVPECFKQGINQMGNFSKGEIRDAKFGSPDWLIYNDSFEWFCLLFGFNSDEPDGYNDNKPSEFQ